jgi:hypothetical protein
MIIEYRATCRLLSAFCLALTCAFLCSSSAGQDTTDNTIEVPLTDATRGVSPLEVHGKGLIHEVIEGPVIEWSWGANVVVKNISDKAITLVFATLTELGRHPESGHRGGLGDGPTYIIAEDRFFKSDIQPSDSVVLHEGAAAVDRVAGWRRRALWRKTWPGMRFARGTLSGDQPSV